MNWKKPPAQEVQSNRTRCIAGLSSARDHPLLQRLHREQGGPLEHGQVPGELVDRLQMIGTTL